MKNDNKKKYTTMTTEELIERKTEIISVFQVRDHLIHGSLITRAVKCGKPNCRCAKGEGHKSLYLSSFYHGERGIDYVPASWENWIQEGIANYRDLEELILELAEIHLALFKRRYKK